MSANLPDRSERELVRTLRSVRRIEPDEQASRQAAGRALATLTRVHSETSASTRRRIIMRSSLAAAILIVVVGAAWVLTSGRQVVAAPTWTDVTRQTGGIDQVYIDAWGYRSGKLVHRGELWIKSPGIIRSREYQLVDDKALPTECSIATPTAAVRWDERTKLGEHASTNNRYMIQSGAASMIEAVLGISLLAERPDPEIRINGELVTFKAVEQKHAQDPSLRGFRLENRSATATAPALAPPFATLTYWFAARSNILCRLTMSMGEGDEAQYSDMAVNLKPDLPPDWFQIKLPADCIDVGAGVLPRLPPELREVYEKVQAAKKRFGDYRAVIWRDRTGGWPSFREATRGDDWRCDTIDWVMLHGAVNADNRQAYVKVAPDDPFAKLWEQVIRRDYELTSTAMTWRGKFAILYYELGGRGPRVSAQLYDAMKDGYEKAFAPALRFTAWPEWMWWENLEPHGWDLRIAPLKWRLVPADPAHPERVEVIGERPTGRWTSIRYSFDRDKDFLCVRQEWTYGAGERFVWEVTSFGRTPDGLWYPRTAKIGNSTYDYAIERGPGDPEFFEYPEGMPQPTDPFAQFQARADQAAASQPDHPPTAQGKCVAVSSRGLPRGFNDKAAMDAHSAMQERMVHISHRLAEYAHDHKWIFPEHLQEMVHQGKLEPKDLQNPLHPDADPPFGYIRPDFKLPNRLERVVLYEPFTTWPGVVTVVFQDHSVEYIHDEAQFRKLAEEATRPETPSR